MAMISYCLSESLSFEETVSTSSLRHVRRHPLNLLNEYQFIFWRCYMQITNCSWCWWNENGAVTPPVAWHHGHVQILITQFPAYSQYFAQKVIIPGTFWSCLVYSDCKRNSLFLIMGMLQNQEPSPGIHTYIWVTYDTCSISNCFFFF